MKRFLLYEKHCIQIVREELTMIFLCNLLPRLTTNSKKKKSYQMNSSLVLKYQD